MNTCVFTIVRDEAVRLPIWMRYYTRHFGANNVVVLDNDSKDGSTTNLGCKVVPVHSKYAFDHAWLLATVQFWLGELLRTHETVVFTECDEILWHPSGIHNYVQALQFEDVTATGYEIIHLPEQEHEPIDISKPIIEQRKHWYRSYAYDKTLITKHHPVSWCQGFHKCFNRRGLVDQELLLVHLHKMDYHLVHEIHAQRQKMQWCPKDLSMGRGGQNRLTGEAFNRWFFVDRNEHELGTNPEPIETIPEELASQFDF